MAYLFDTNILIRLANAGDPNRPVALSALRTLRARREALCSTPQVMSEFWNVATRPTTARGGLGLASSDVESKVAVVERRFRLLHDSPATYQEWRRLVVAYAVVGLAVHDAKLVASMIVHEVTHLLTFNTGDFARYVGVITVVDPARV